MRTLSVAPEEFVTDRTGTFVDLIEDVLHLDNPVRPSMRRRVQLANDEAVRTLRHLATEDESIIAPDSVRAICNAVATRHGVKPRFMLTTRELGEQLSFEFAAAALAPPLRSRLIASSVHLERKRVEANPSRGRSHENPPDHGVEILALAQAVLAVVAIIGAIVMLSAGSTTIGLGFAIASISLVVAARAVLVLSADNRAHVLPDVAPVLAHDAPRPPGSIGLEIDLRGNDA